mmetsp:Transcript_4923/g.14330  ORF Transcript_4923/g.14330 Transcript_4923/m.14330 type:complete len:441 (-) Transcript_4923:272-1594(-)
MIMRPRSQSCGPPLSQGGCATRWRESGPIGDEELRLLSDLEELPADGWKELPAGCGAEGLRLLLRQSSVGGRSSEVRASLILSLPAEDIFEHLYSCAFLRSCFPKWGFEISTGDAVELGSDLVRITSKRIDLSWRWRRLSRDPVTAGVCWLMRPAEPEAVEAHQLPGSQHGKLGTGGRSTVGGRIDLLGLADAIFGFGLKPISSPDGAACKLFVYMRLPGNGFLMRTVLGSVCPKFFKRISGDLYDQTGALDTPENSAGHSASGQEAESQTEVGEGSLPDEHRPDCSGERAEDADAAAGRPVVDTRKADGHSPTPSVGGDDCWTPPRRAEEGEQQRLVAEDAVGAPAPSDAAERRGGVGHQHFDGESLAPSALQPTARSVVASRPFVRGCPIAKPRRPRWRRTGTLEAAGSVSSKLRLALLPPPQAEGAGCGSEGVFWEV